MDSNNNPSTESSYSDDDEQYGHGYGEGFDLPSPWEDRVFWENRSVNQNHFYRTSSTFTSSSTASTEAGNDQKVVAAPEKEADSKADSPSIGSDDGEEYQVAVSRGKDGKYHVSTSAENMDGEVMAMFSPSVSGDNGNDAEGSSSVFRVKSEMKSKGVPSLASASTNSSEWSNKEDEDESVNTTSSVRSVLMLLLSGATIGYVIATNVADGTKLIKTAIEEPNGMNDYSTFEHQESHAAEAVAEFEEYCKRGANEVFFYLLFQLTNLVQNLTNLNIWREKAEDLLTGALPMSWAGW